MEKINIGDGARAQVARVLTFPAQLVPHINWNSIGEMRAQLACDIDVRRTKDADTPSADALTITLFWPNTEGVET